MIIIKKLKEWFKIKISDYFSVPTMTLKKIRPYFTTMDGVEHLGPRYNWIKVSGRASSAEDLLMRDIKCDGYITDEYGVMYPLTSVMSVRWVTYDMINVPQYDRYKVYYSDKEVDEIRKEEEKHENIERN